MGTATLTPNIGLQIPGYNQANWQVPTDFNWNLLDGIFGGSIQVPALNVVSLTVQNFNIANLGSALASMCVQEAPGGTYPGTVYTLTRAPILMMGLYYNGQFLVPVVSYTTSGNAITLKFNTNAGDSLYAVYF